MANGFVQTLRLIRDFFRPVPIYTPAPTPVPVPIPDTPTRVTVYGRGHVTYLFEDCRVILHGGPYKDKPSHLAGIKMAVEIDAPYAIKCDTRDFSVPHPDSMRLAIHLLYSRILYTEARGRLEFYVGCMGGLGRTGLFLACWTKFYNALYGIKGDPVQWVRGAYHSSAVETVEQQKFVEALSIEDLLP